MNFGQTILELRKKKNVTQEEMAAELGVTAAAVSKWENNYTLPDILMLCILADYFQVTTDKLLGRNSALTYATVVAATPELGVKIEKLSNRYGFAVTRQFSSFRPALDYVLSNEEIHHIFIGLNDTLDKQDIDATPAHVHAIQSVGNNDQDILDGFEMIFRYKMP